MTQEEFVKAVEEYRNRLKARGVNIDGVAAADAAIKQHEDGKLDVYKYTPGTPLFSPSQKISTAPFPLDRLKLDGNTGIWSATSDPDDTKNDESGAWNGFIYDWGMGPKSESIAPGTAPSDTCNHQWVDIGFQHSKFVCSKCNKDKPPGA